MSTLDVALSIRLCLAQFSSEAASGARWLKAKRPEVALDIIQSWTVREYRKRLDSTGNTERNVAVMKPEQVTVQEQIKLVQHDKNKAPTVSVINEVAEAANAAMADVPAVAAETLGAATKEGTGPLPPIG